MRAELKRWQKELGFTFVHVTHSQEEAMALADKVVVMNQGRIEQEGPPHDVFNAPRTEFVARFMGGHNVIDLGETLVAARTDRTRLWRNAPGRTCLRARVRAVEYQGTYVLVTMQRETLDARLNGGIGSGEIAAMLPEAEFYAQPWSPDDVAWVSWDDAHALQAARLAA